MLLQQLHAVPQHDLGCVPGRDDVRRWHRRLQGHFPSLDELVPACGAVSMEVIAPPDPAGASSLFEDVDDSGARIERLVREAFSIYERGAPELHVARNEPDAHPSVAQVGEALEASLTALIDAAGVEASKRAVVRAMIDLGTWQALRDQGLGPAEAVAAVGGMLAGGLI